MPLYKSNILTVSYTEITSTVAINTTAEATANTVITAPALVANGVDTYWFEFFSPLVATVAAGPNGQVNVVLYDGSSIGLWGLMNNTAAFTEQVPMLLRRRFIPTAASHTYSVRAYEALGNGSVGAGAGGSGNVMPAYFLISKSI